MSFATAWINECEDRFGEKMSARIRMRLMDGQNHIKGNRAEDFSLWTQSSGTTTFGSIETFTGGLTENWLEDRDGKAFIKGSGSYTYSFIYQNLDETFKSDNIGLCFFKMDNCYHGQGGINRRNFISLYDSTDSQHHYMNFQFDVSGTMTAGSSTAIDDSGVVDVGDGWYMGWIYVDGATRGIVGNDIQARVYANNGSTVVGDSVFVFCPQVQFGTQEPLLDCLTTPDETNTYAVLGTYKELTDVESITALSPIRRQRERKFGVLQARDWQVQFTNTTQYFKDKKLIGGWLELQAGFVDADLWETVGVGQIEDTSATSKATVTINLIDRIRALLDSELERDMYFGDAGWASNIVAVAVDDSSDDYENDWDGDDEDEGVLVNKSVNAMNETITIEFTSSTVYKAILEDGTEQTGLSISSDELIDGQDASDVYEVKSAGWDGTYATGDTFEFHASEDFPTTYLTPVGIPYYLITDFLNIKWVNVLSGLYENVVDLADTLTWLTELSVWASDRVMGFRPKGTSVISMIQDCMKLCHGSIITKPNGKLKLYLLGESESSITLESEPGHGNNITLLSSEHIDNLKHTAKKVTFNYKTLSGDDASYSAEADVTDFATAITAKTFDIGWRVHAQTIESATNIFLLRFADARRTFNSQATLAGAIVDLDKAVTIHETMIDSDAYVLSEVGSVELNIMQNRVKIISYLDPVAMSTFARVADIHGVGTLVDDGLGTYSTDPIF